MYMIRAIVFIDTFRTRPYKVADSTVCACIPGVKVDGHRVRPCTVFLTQVHLTHTYKLS